MPTEEIDPKPPLTRICCPHCGTDDTRKVSLMYEQATSNLNFQSLALKDNGTATYTAGSGGLQNLMGGRIAPPVSPAVPSKPRFAFCSSIVFVWGSVIFIGGNLSHAEALWLGWGVIAPSVFFLFRYMARLSSYSAYANTYRTTLLPTHEQQMARWSRSWMCMRCGDLFERR